MDSNADMAKVSPAGPNGPQGDPAGPPPVPEPPRIHAVPVPRPGRWIAAIVVLVVVAQIVHGAIVSPNMRWDVVGEYLFSPEILRGLWLTLELTAIAMVLGFVLGVVLAVFRLSDNPVLNTISYVYGWIFRGTPLIAQLLFWYFLSAVVPEIGLGIPFGPTFVSWPTNEVMTQMMAALLGLGLNEAAFSAEIVRAGIISVDSGQQEAARSLGLSNWQILRKIVLPQAMRVIIPPLGNDLISLLKNTSLVLVIALPDLLTSAQTIYSRNFLQIPLLLVACFWYLVVFTILGIGQHFVERRFSRGNSRTVAPSVWRSAARMLRPGRRRLG